MALKQYVTDEKDYLVSLRRYFHAHPEVSLKEYNTCKKIEEELDKIGLKGSPTNIFKSFTPPLKGVGVMLEGADKKTAETLADILLEKHVI